MKYKKINTEVFVEDAKNRLNVLKEIQADLEQRAKEYPSGRILVHKKTNKSIQFELKQNDKGIKREYVSLYDADKLSKYLQKGYDLKILPFLKSEICTLERLVKNAEKANFQNVYSTYPDAVKQYITPIELPGEDFAKAWIDSPYEKKQIDQSLYDFVTERGDVVRSKSELIIANKLFSMNIPYRYECRLTLSNGVVIYPDFTVLDVRNRREVYWEHRGMMDDRDYVKHTVKRIREYEQNGYFLGDRLIITEETSMNPMGTKDIERTIKHYFFDSTLRRYT